MKSKKSKISIDIISRGWYTITGPKRPERKKQDEKKRSHGGSFEADGIRS